MNLSLRFFAPFSHDGRIDESARRSHTHFGFEIGQRKQKILTRDPELL
ncbi:hypothetical protein NBRC3293_0961 [Gluconobacter oxydans NBRC 3293]|uniref:Uncharacterized protein n=1 Tax=Gluconobacter oxydans NBRC 3293 TaxID=1315969 RepID=A0A829WX76_GLUOY|nr:hypothetical protein NBRC3293_0961 [Gluconobacter oxydans NBRC 3293]